MFFLSNAIAWAICVLFAYVNFGTSVTVALTIALLSYFIYMERYKVELQQFKKCEDSTGKVIDDYVQECEKLETKKAECLMKIENLESEIREIETEIRTNATRDSKRISELTIGLKRKQIEVRYLKSVKTTLTKRLSNQKEVIEVLQTTRTSHCNRTDVQTQHKLEELNNKDAALQQKSDDVVSKLETLHNTPDEHIEALDAETPEADDDSESDDNTVNEAHVDAEPYNVAVENHVSGQPKADYVSTDIIVLSWSRPIDYQNCEYYQVSYRIHTDESMWIVYPEEFRNNTGVLRDLASDTEYLFRVRAVNRGTEEPYSEVSEVIETPRSPFSRLVQRLDPIRRADTSPTLYVVPTKEIQDARSENYQIRKLEVGTSAHNVKEKTILLVGETGTGKSTLVNAMVNYIMGVKWDDPIRLSFVHQGEGHTDQELSQTEWITCYAINHDVGNRIPFTINIIDTPGFGAIQSNLKIAEQICGLFTEQPPTGISTIDAICFVAKAHDARLTPLQIYIFRTIMSLFGKDVSRNICTFITFADGDPPILAALHASQLPFGEKFKFNNASLYEKHNNQSKQSFHHLCWEMSINSFRLFFKHLSTLEQKSTLLTSKVLDTNKRLEEILNVMQQNTIAGFKKIDEISSELRRCEEIKFIMEGHKDHYRPVNVDKVIKRELPNGERVTTCMDCNITCHDKCTEATTDGENTRCIVFDEKGYCRICNLKCHSSRQTSVTYKFEIITVNEMSIIMGVKQCYDDAAGQLVVKEKLLENLCRQLGETKRIIEYMIHDVEQYNERLAEISLCPNPQIMDIIELLIKIEMLLPKSKISISLTKSRRRLKF